MADLAIERREGHENYGMGSITDNDLTKLIDFANASPRPIVVRYVLQLTKPLDEILEEMKARIKSKKMRHLVKISSLILGCRIRIKINPEYLWNRLLLFARY